MRITENFVDPLDDRTDGMVQISVHLTKRSDGQQYVQLDFSKMTPRIEAERLSTLIGMLQALERRAERG